MLRLAAALLLTCGVVAVSLTTTASALLRSAQAEDQAAYDMDALVGLPPVPARDTDVVAALEAWRNSAVTVDQAGRETVDPALLDLVSSFVTWHVWLDALFIVPSVTLLLAWLLRRCLVRRSAAWWLGIPLAYLVLDLAETLWTGWLVGHLLDGGEPVTSSWATAVLPVLTLLKWTVLASALLVALLASLARPRRFVGVRRGLRRLWAVRVQAVVCLVFGVLIAAPLSGPLDQIPDLLRSAHDRGWLSASFLVPTAVLGGLAALLWSTGMLVVAALRAHPEAPDPEDETLPDPAPDPEPTPEPTPETTVPQPDVPAWSWRAWFRTRRRWLVLLGVVAVLAAVVLALDDLQPSYGVLALPLLLLAGLLLDLLLDRLGHRVAERSSAAHRWRVGPQDAGPVEWWVDLFAAAMLAIGGLGAVRAYGVLVLLQVGDPARPVHPGAVEWLVFGVVMSTVAPVAAFAGLRWLARREGRFRVARVLLAAVGVPAWAAGVAAVVWPAEVGRVLEAHGVVALWLCLVVSLFGLLQWDAERSEPIPLARALGLGRSPWIACVLLVPLLASQLDGRVGYHATTLRTDGSAEAATGAQLSMGQAYRQWLAAAQECRGAEATELPLVLVAAPGGGARAAYWTTEVMSALEDRDACGGGTVFAASGVSGGSVGLATWAATRDLEPDDAREQLTDLVGSDALDATVAGLLFRDLTRAFVPVHLQGRDRAAVEQRVWVDAVPGLAESFLPDATAAPAGWDPLLLLNASDLASGCKVLLSQVRVLPAVAADASQDDVGSGQRVSGACRQHPDPSVREASTLEAGTVDGALFLDPAACPADDSEVGSDDIDLAAASLLSARFPYVSPLGVLTRCELPGGAGGGTGNDGKGPTPREHLFVGDGGYLENTGLHSLLALWNDLEPYVRTGDPRVRPVVVLVENHYRSAASLRSRDRLGELTAPPQADRATLVGSAALEQVVAAEFKDRWFVVAPHTRPSLAAPLGWSLSQAARTALDCELPVELSGADPGTATETGAATEAYAPPDVELCTEGRRPTDEEVGELVGLMGHP